MREYAEHEDAVVRVATVDTTDAVALEAHARRLRAPEAVRQLADNLEALEDGDLIARLRELAVPDRVWVRRVRP